MIASSASSKALHCNTKHNRARCCGHFFSLSNRQMSRKKAPASAAAPKDLSPELQECFTVLKFFQSKEDAEPFLEPVDWKKYSLPDYPEIIKHPMDLGTVEKKLIGNKYKNTEAFAADVRLVWKNAMTYNRADSGIYQTADNLAKLFEKKIVKAKKGGAPAAGAAATPSSTTKRKREATPKGESREATRQDRVKFSQLVNQLSSDQLGHVVSIIQQQCPDALNEEDDEELEIEINSIDSSTLLSLTAYATECIANGNSKKKKR